MSESLWHTPIHISVHTCTHTCTHIHAYTHIYTHTHTQVARAQPRVRTKWNYASLLTAQETRNLDSMARISRLSNVLKTVHTHTDASGKDRLECIAWPPDVLCTDNFWRTVSWKNAPAEDLLAEAGFVLNEYLRIAEVRHCVCVYVCVCVTHNKIMFMFPTEVW